MAKQKRGLFELSGTLGLVTFVQTRKGPIVRRARGTVTGAECNAKLREQVDLNKTVNAAAKLVHDAARVYATGFKKTDLWQEIQSRMRKRKTPDFGEMLQALEGMELNNKHRLQRIMPGVGVQVETTEGIMTLTLTGGQVHFNSALRADCYYTEALVVFADDECYPVDMVCMNNGWIGVKDLSGNTVTSFEIPVNARHWVVLLKVQGGKRQTVIEDMRATGISVAKSGEVW